MKIEQKPIFQPITITLETEDEAEALWAAVRGDMPETKNFDNILIKISDWFSMKAKI